MLKLIKNKDAKVDISIDLKRPIIDLTKVDFEKINNPVGYLQEFIQKRGTSMPIYHLGTETSSPFSCTVTLPSDSPATARGYGNKKSESKMNSAIKLLNMLKEEAFIQNLNRCSTTASSTSESGVGEGGSGSLTKISRHPVSQLQEFCQKRKVFAPLYHYYQKKGLNGEMEYTCVCRINTFNLEVRETKRNQKEARKAAAKEMLRLLIQAIQPRQLIL